MLSSIRGRLLAVAAFSGLVSLGLVTAGWTAVRSLADSAAQQNSAADLMQLSMAADMRHDALRSDVLAAIVNEDPAAARAAADDAAKSGRDLSEKLRTIVSSTTGDTRDQAEKITPIVADYVSRALAITQQALSDKAAARAAMPAFQTAFTAVEESMEALSGRIAASADSAMQELQASKAAATTTLLVIGGLGTFAVIAATLLVSGMISGSVRRIADRLAAIAEGTGTLESRVITSDEKSELDKIAQAFNGFSKTILTAMMQVMRLIGAMRNGSEQIAAATEQSSRSMDRQAQSVQQMAVMLEQIVESNSAVSTQADAAASAVQQARTFAEQGNDIVGRTIDRMHLIDRAVSDGSASVASLGERSEQIGRIISVINDIADQTNLLALNAAIEAARAGEHGRGFAVVADEVRKLAERTTTATKEVADSIRQIQAETKTAVEKMTTGTEQVKEGVQMAASASDGLRQIVQTVNDTAQAISSINASAQQQASLSGDIKQQISAITASTAEAQTASSSTAQSVSDLARQARELADLLSNFCGDRRAAGSKGERIRPTGVVNTSAGPLIDLSTSGAQIRTEMQPAPAKGQSIQFTIPSASGEAIPVSGKVAWSKDDADGRTRVGIRFDSTPSGLSKAMQDLRAAAQRAGGKTAARR